MEKMATFADVLKQRKIGIYMGSRKSCTCSHNVRVLMKRQGEEEKHSSQEGKDAKKLASTDEVVNL